MSLTNLAHHIDIDFLRVAFDKTRKSGAVGVDRQTGLEYAKNLESLLSRFKSGSYKAPPVLRAEIPKKEGREVFLGWVHSGFSVHAKHRIAAGDSENLEKMARYATRAPIRLASIEIAASGKVLVATPRDPKTGTTSLVLDPVEFIHQVANQIPDPRMHMVRYYGVYANRVRKDYAACSSMELGCDDEPDDLSVGENKSRASWARLIRKIFEVDPLLCPNCHVHMKVVAVITEPKVIDKILKHRSRSGKRDVFEPRAPPSASH